jgi:hypothetical protein
MRPVVVNWCRPIAADLEEDKAMCSTCGCTPKKAAKKTAKKAAKKK